ncbi:MULTISPECIES: CBASS oligonucleotide cyclase [Bacillus subtilis group]|uniref:CBASS oligonucleotide cyclase n=1 Tax=Bacillus subtilis group TaxID=653685 RepID=UPI0011E8F092|nr:MULTISPECIES: CBASS oligonucleotide cyclase [Bacillus subtilis group]MCY8717018.1 nucleotidyltransferase [Bacillus spizizenii]MCY9108883.1 nucleotidyltransferase [Bacillus atrophaeus]TYS07596.1 nucleotidyltransferase [Bacillus subtilis]TYS22774.1 nucleotidyltransferase [Bacillus subtilis]
MSGSSWNSIPSKTLSELEAEREDQVEQQRFESELNEFIRELFQNINDRDVEGIRNHLDTLKQAMEKELEGSVQMIFGGSINKNTYISGISDVDMLVQINDESLSGAKPYEVMKTIKDKIKKRLPNTEVTIGNLALTVKFSSGHEIQLLPSIKTNTGYKIAKANDNSWSNVIKPKKFAEKLTKVNQKNGNKIVPLIKLIKKINSTLPQTKQLSGYHIESLAIDAFKNNTQAPRSYKGLVEYFYRHAEKAVLNPIKDSTGQSIHVDTYLGGVGSSKRKEVSTVLNRVLSRIERANKSYSIDEWKKILGD